MYIFSDNHGIVTLCVSMSLANKDTVLVRRVFKYLAKATTAKQIKEKVSLHFFFSG